MSDAQAAETRAKINQALDLVGDIAAGDARWRMSVPADVNKDSDLILSDALMHGLDALEENVRLRAEIEELTRGR